MDGTIFLSKCYDALRLERTEILARELETDFAILRKQRHGESVPPRHYWAIKTFPRSFQESYVKCLAEEPASEFGEMTKVEIFRRARQFSTLVLMQWAERPSMEVTEEQLKKWNVEAAAYDRKTGYYKEQVKNLCKKAEVKRAFRDRYYKMTGRRMRATEEDSIFADESPVVIGDARVVVEWDCGGWTHFREEIGIEWQNKMSFVQRSLCSWLGFFPVGGEGWGWILKDDLDQAAHDAVQQTIQFRDILVKAVRKALE